MKVEARHVGLVVGVGGEAVAQAAGERYQVSGLGDVCPVADARGRVPRPCASGAGSSMSSTAPGTPAGNRP